MGARRYQVSRPIEAPAATVWALLTNADSYADWNKAVLSIAGAIRPGNTIELVSIADPKRTFKLTVKEMLEPSHMVWIAGMPLGLFTGRRTYTIADTAHSTSEFTMVEEFAGPLAALITKAIPDLSASFNLFADSLKEAAEHREVR
jgi:uncharacterized protein YndB with AHSA1/START domain